MEFIEAFRNAKKETFRLELLDSYMVDSERSSFEAFKKGTAVDSPAIEEWAKELRALNEKGVATRRVHAVTLPLSEYLRFEIECYKKTGEEIRLISRAYYTKAVRGAPLKDFWLIDDDLLFLVDYDRMGGWLGFSQVRSRFKIKEHKEFKEALLELSLPVDQFIDANKGMV